MTISQSIDALPTAPTRSDPASFDTRADAYLSALVTFSAQIETFRTQANTTASDVNSDKSAAEVAKAGAESAYGAALTVANATFWNSATTYNINDTVIAPNGYCYRALANNTNDNPASSATGAWLLLIVGAALIEDYGTVSGSVTDFLDYGSII